MISWRSNTGKISTVISQTKAGIFPEKKNDFKNEHSKKSMEEVSRDIYGQTSKDICYDILGEIVGIIPYMRII